MLRFAADENFNGDILRGLLRRRPDLDVLRVQDVPQVFSTPDPVVLGWCADEDRVLLTHDAKTIAKFAYDRVDSGLAMPGIVVAGGSVTIRQAIDDILLLAECSEPDDLKDRIIYLPLD